MVVVARGAAAFALVPNAPGAALIVTGVGGARRRAAVLVGDALVSGGLPARLCRIGGIHGLDSAVIRPASRPRLRRSRFRTRS